MSLIDFILNVAGLLLWLNWRGDSLCAVKPARKIHRHHGPAGWGFRAARLLSGGANRITGNSGGCLLAIGRAN
jgi:hypothetical protein